MTCRFEDGYHGSYVEEIVRNFIKLHNKKFLKVPFLCAGAFGDFGKGAGVLRGTSGSISMPSACGMDSWSKGEGPLSMALSRSPSQN